MKRVYKYVLQVTDEQTIEIPSEKILSVESQGDNIVVYALVDMDEKTIFKYEYEFRTYGTGHDIPDDIYFFTFLGTVKMYNGSSMFHVFYKK